MPSDEHGNVYHRPHLEQDVEGLLEWLEEERDKAAILRREPYVSTGALNAIAATIAELRAEVAQANEVRDRAVREAVRRDEKWMEGINAIVGEDLSYGIEPESFTVVPPPRLDQWVRRQRAELEQRDAALREYGRHHSGCAANRMPEEFWPMDHPGCTCGFDRTLTPAPETGEVSECNLWINKPEGYVRCSTHHINFPLAEDDGGDLCPNAKEETGEASDAK